MKYDSQTQDFINELPSCLLIVPWNETCSIGYEYWSVCVTIILHSYSMNLQS